jgi:alpha/beta superfamily hydrolase
MGLGAQMILWDDGFCEQLAERGFFVIRFDNRDIGKSTKINGAGAGAAEAPRKCAYREADRGALHLA